jgi:cytochrome c biogenesis protein CcdA
MATTHPVADETTKPAQHGALPALMRYGKSFAIGSAFAVGWTPCIGPILGAILALSWASGTVLHGAFLLSAWSLGLGVPFLIAGAMLGQVMRGIRKLRPVMPVLEVLGGLLVIVIGAMIFLDKFTVFNQYFTGGASTVTNAEGGLTGIDVASPGGFLVAFGAGVIAFISPCCLPMVPAYLAHLAGVSADAIDERRWVTFRHSVAFVAGFSMLFVALGASSGAIAHFSSGHANFVRDNLSTIEKVAGVLLIVMGLNLIGILRIPLLYRTYQIELPGTSPEAQPRT